MNKKDAFILISNLCVEKGTPLHVRALGIICEDTGERRKTVRAKRPVQQTKVKIPRCPYDGDCDVSTVCPDVG